MFQLKSATRTMLGLTVASWLVLGAGLPANGQEDFPEPPAGYPEVVLDEFADLEGTVITPPTNLDPPPRVLVPVRIVADSLLDEVDAVGVDCSLFSSVMEEEAGDNVVIASGYAVAVRQGRTLTSFVDPEAPNQRSYSAPAGDRVEVTFVVPFFTEDDATPIEFWTDGECQLYLFRGSDATPISPETCNVGDFSPPYHADDRNRMLGCVWPGTDPEKSYVTFARPGLEALNPSTGGVFDPELTPHATESDQ